MSELEIPESWAVTELQHISTFINGRAFKSSEWSKSGLPIIRIQNINETNPNCLNFNYFLGDFDKRIFVSAGDLLFSWSGSIGTSFGARIWDGPDGVLNQHIFKVSLARGIDKKFYFHQLNANIADIEGQAHGGVGLAHITKTKLERVGFSIPPIEEQHRIVTKIDSSFTKIDATEKALDEAEALLKKYRESLLAKAFRGELVPQDPKDEPASELLKRIRAERDKQNVEKKRAKDELPPIAAEDVPFEVPKSWEWVRLGELSLKIVDGTHHTPKYTNDGVHFVSAKDIVDGEVRLNDTKYISAGEHAELIKRTHPEVGDILVTKSGTIGRTAVVKTTIPFSLFESVALVKLQGGLSPEYIDGAVALYVNSVAGLGRVKGAAIKHLHLEELREALVPLPPFAEQVRIINKLQKQKASWITVRTTISTLANLIAKEKTAILSSAFSGRLVPQLPEEGTGHELLQQILNTKAAEIEADQKPSRRLKPAPKGKKRNDQQRTAL